MKYRLHVMGLAGAGLWLALTLPLQANESHPNPVDIPPEVLEESPLLQRWVEEVPDVDAEIHHDPAFRTRLRVGGVELPSTDEGTGFGVGVEDLFLGDTPLTVSGEFQQNWEGDRSQFGADLRYYVLPLGSYINIAPVLGYRSLETDAYDTDGIHLGLRVVAVPSRTSAADLSLTQSWVDPGSDDEVGLTALSAGYAFTPDLRLSADFRWQNSPEDKDTQWGLFLEWMP
ncbi:MULTISPECIES: hypothetical protein [unclassified Leptolyngbya]|uniref:hypothetical protein n=1 Tax=unclassified Leptolyngbya TaxID=2650499 RepID=UPI0016853A42|nr:MULTISPECIES: hypothetical protein [unclassified Leptolyngbya]MBD1911165.1 hypothetical protein [Leptolyngbya sp. FACHB-8]MBD2154364.1 hypothetical protein [Leptolyngbya sp. FACHB-16]